MQDDYREVLYTVDRSGRRKWVYSTSAWGRFRRHRRAAAAFLIAFYLLLPWTTVNGRQAVMLNITERKFIFFGAEFWATDTFLLFLTFGILAFSLFFFTALLGRVWCGWACPETVFLEFLFRPIERMIEGDAVRRRRLDEQAWNLEKLFKKGLKHFLCAAASWVIASSFLAYLVGREPLLEMIQGSPLNHPLPFSLTVIFMGLMAFQFGWFREQFCTIVCPYARFQSVLMDSNSIVVGYDVVRGEPRGKRGAHGSQQKGDCIDCGYCIRVCPTGIDIRNGVQLECIACTECIDACDSIMAKIGRPLGLIRYDTEERLLGRSETPRLIRPRIVAYAAILLLFLAGFVGVLTFRNPVDFQILRGAGSPPFRLLEDGRISNQFTARLGNKSGAAVFFELSVDPSFRGEVIIPLNPVTVAAETIRDVPLFINFNRSSDTARSVRIFIKGEGGYKSFQEVPLIAPDK